MKKKYFLSTAVMLAIAALTLGAALMVSRTKSQPPVPTAPQSVIAQTSRPRSEGGPKEAIKVHGHWLIEVRNPDGSLADRREFENALVPGSGDAILTWVLTHQYNAGMWIVLLNPGVCIQANGVDSPLGVNCAKTLTVTTPQPVPPAQAYSIVLAGNVTVTTGTTISSVDTHNWLCPSNLTAAQCAASNPENNVLTFTSHPLINGTSTPPVTVVTGQSIQVTVTISFS